MTLSHPRPKLSTRGVDRVVADDLQTLCLGLERVVPSCPTNPVVWILMNSFNSWKVSQIAQNFAAVCWKAGFVAHVPTY
jgi:hypothetical protein